MKLRLGFELISSALFMLLASRSRVRRFLRFYTFENISAACMLSSSFLTLTGLGRQSDQNPCGHMKTRRFELFSDCFMYIRTLLLSTCASSSVLKPLLGWNEKSEWFAEQSVMKQRLSINKMNNGVILESFILNMVVLHNTCCIYIGWGWGVLSQ